MNDLSRKSQITFIVVNLVYNTSVIVTSSADIGNPETFKNWTIHIVRFTAMKIIAY